MAQAEGDSASMHELKIWAYVNRGNLRTVCAIAAEEGNLPVLQMARENGCEWDESTCANAAGGGHLEVLQWARENGCEWDEWTCANAAGGGHLKVLQFYIQH